MPVENCFKINVNVYNKTEEGLCSILRQSLGKYEDDLNLDEYMGHMSYIINFANYANNFECNRCEKIFRRRQVGIYGTKNEIFYPYFTSYDIKAIVMHVTYTQNNKLKWLAKHIPLCFGLCCNIPGYKEPYVYINDDMDELVDNMI